MASSFSDKQSEKGFRRHSPVDHLIGQIDHALRTVSGNIGPTVRPSPGRDTGEPILTADERRESARLMRVNHCGEVCAQALYEGQALTAKSPRTAASLKEAASEETDHLSWCESRIRELDSNVSVLNPFWYAASFSMGAVAGLMGDKVNLGFVAATEEQVEDHLEEHLGRLPAGDERSRAILQQMKEDEARHGQNALDMGGAMFPRAVKSLMRTVSGAMTRTTYWI